MTARWPGWLRRGARPAAPRLPPLPPAAGNDGVPPIDEQHATADQATRARDRAAADPMWRAITDQDPADPLRWVQYGHALKEGGRVAEAEDAYVRAVRLAPHVADPHLQLGHLHKIRGRRDLAIPSYARALELDPGLDDARDELIFLGARDAIPAAALDRKLHWARLQAATDVLAAGERARHDWLTASTYPLAAYDRFRREIPIRPPPTAPAAPAPGALLIVVDATIAAPAYLRATLRSLGEQSIPAWRAVVRAPDAIRQHPVGSFASLDPRIGFVGVDDRDIPAGAAQVVSLAAGTVLHGEALAWLCWTAERTGCPAVLCDHDRAIEFWRQGLSHAEPTLYGVFDADWMAGGSLPPAALLVAASLYRAQPATAGDERRALSLAAARAGGVAHVPRLLASVLDLPLIAEGGSATGAPGEEAALRAPARAQRAESLPSPTPAVPAPADERMLVVIPTRDGHALLRKALATLRQRAANPERLDFLVVDNRSTTPEMALLLADETAAGRLKAMRLDEPFNWSRANNLAAATGEQAHLLFVNDDTEMLTDGWDARLGGLLRRPEIGAVGARLLYPNGTVQHAGIVCGIRGGAPVHMGRGAPAGDPGPNRAWIEPHGVASVTGAFLAVRRSVFDQVQGFDAARFFVDYADIDFSFRIRELGLLVHYAADLELLHHESVTRGLNDTKARVAWDQGELTDFHARWGEWVSQDPGYSPYLAIDGQPFDGIREPGMREIVRHIDLSARAHPWRPSRLGEQQAEQWTPAALL